MPEKLQLSIGIQPADLEVNMQLKNNVRTLCSRVQTILRQRRRKEKKRVHVISAPFNLTLEPVSLPGISEDEIAILREKAAASRIGVAEAMPRSPSSMLSEHRPSPIVTVLPPRAMACHPVNM